MKVEKTFFITVLLSIPFICLGNPKYIPETLSQALEQKAEKGDAKAQNDLGIAYLLGKGVEKNSKKAFELFKKSNDQGNIVAGYYMGICLGSGDGVEQNKEKALYYIQKAADEGLVEAENNLAGIYFTGDGVLKDEAKAISILKKASNKKYPLATYNYANLTMEKSSSDSEQKEAFKIMEDLAKQEEPDAQAAVGVWNLNGKGTTKNEVEAFRWLRRAVDNGNKEALYKIAEMYEEGVGTITDRIKALEFYAKYALEDPDAIVMITLMSKLSETEQKVRDQKVFEVASWHADKGNRKMQAVLAGFYQNGVVVEKNLNKAVELFKKSSEQGWEPAKKALEKINQDSVKQQSSTNPQQTP
jgi:hypothetical protein